jgi:hypothetical protein
MFQEMLFKRARDKNKERLSCNIQLILPSITIHFISTTLLRELWIHILICSILAERKEGSLGSCPQQLLSITNSPICATAPQSSPFFLRITDHNPSKMTVNDPRPLPPPSSPPYPPSPHLRRPLSPPPALPPPTNIQASILVRPTSLLHVDAFSYIKRMPAVTSWCLLGCYTVVSLLLLHCCCYTSVYTALLLLFIQRNHLSVSSECPLSPCHAVLVLVCRLV